MTSVLVTRLFRDSRLADESAFSLVIDRTVLQLLSAGETASRGRLENSQRRSERNKLARLLGRFGFQSFHPPSSPILPALLGLSDSTGGVGREGEGGEAG